MEQRLVCVTQVTRNSTLSSSAMATNPAWLADARRTAELYKGTAKAASLGDRGRMVRAIVLPTLRPWVAVAETAVGAGGQSRSASGGVSADKARSPGQLVLTAVVELFWRFMEEQLPFTEDKDLPAVFEATAALLELYASAARA